MNFKNHLIRFFVDEVEYSTLIGNTTMQASLAIGLDIPRFCYHEKLSIAGNCRMCLLEISYPRSLKPMASCALPVIQGMSFYTNTMMVKKSREGVLEFLLLNHPLDCPVCDQGGECDLQDETARFGGDRGRFYESKRAVEDKELGPLIKTSMNRCIHCTKCVRFSQEVCGESSLGTLGRGSAMEIGTYIEESLDSEFSGNLIDICPVGALTSKPYAFRARPWELRSFETVDVIDSVGSKIRVDIRGTEIMRVLPSQSEDVNEDWITDRTRFSYDGLKIQRLHSPMIRVHLNLIPVSWELAIEVSAFFLSCFVVGGNSNEHKPETYLNLFLNRKASVLCFFGDLADVETLVVLSDFFRELGSGFVVFQDHFELSFDFRSNYLLNLPLNFIEKIDLCVFVGLNMRLELPLVNLRIRKAFLYNNALIISFGFITNLTYQCYQQGNALSFFFKFLNGKSYASKCLLDSIFPIVFLGSSFLKFIGEHLVFDLFHCLSKYSNILTKNGWGGLNFVNGAVSSIGFKELGLNLCYPLNNLNDSACFFYLFGVERFLNLNAISNFFCFKIFQGHSGDLNVVDADVVLPGTTFVEKETTYITLEGRVQKTKFLLTGPSLSRVDWKIIASLRVFFFINYSYDSFDVLNSPKNYLLREEVNKPKELSKIEKIRERLYEYSPAFHVAHKLVFENSFHFNFFFLKSLITILLELFFLCIIF